MTLLDILEEDNIKLGKIIKYYRTNDYKIANPYTWSINDFISDNDEYICSNTTLSSIENGEIIKDDEIYDSLLQKLNLKYNYKNDLSNIHNAYDSLIIEEFNNFNFDKINIILDEYINILTEYKDFVIENEYIEQLDFIRNHANKLDNSNIELYNNTILKSVELFNIYTDGIKLLLQNILIRISLKFYDTKTRVEILNKKDIKSSKSYLIKSIYADYLITISDYYNAFKIILPIIEIYENENNINGIILTLSTKIRLMADTNTVNWIKYAEEAISFIKNNNCDRSIAISSLHYLGLTLYLYKEYNLAYEVFIYLIEKYNYNDLFFPLQVNVVCFLLEIPVPREVIIKRNPINNSIAANTIFDFFVLKEEGASIEELEDYIIAEIKPILRFCDRPTYDIFYNILELLISKTNNRNKLYNYKQLRKKSYDD